MTDEPPSRTYDAEEPDAASRGLSLLSSVRFNRPESADILKDAAAAATTLTPCRTEASYRTTDGAWELWPPSQTKRPEIDRLVEDSGGDGQVEVPGRGWGHALGLRHQGTLNGCLIVSAAAPPDSNCVLLLSVLAQLAGAALACAEVHQRDVRSAAQLETANTKLATAVEQLRSQANVHEILGAALAAGAGEQGLADALHGLTGFPVALEDRFGNLRCWAGPGLPRRYPKTSANRREVLLHRLAASVTATRVGDRLTTLVRPRAETLGVLSLVVADAEVTSDVVFALGYCGTMLGLELSHERHVAEVELDVRREFVNDLLAGTDEEGAYARSEALGHDLRRPHYVVVVHRPGGESGLAVAAGQATSAMHMACLQGRHSGLTVLLIDDRPDPARLHRLISQITGTSSTVIGIGSRCDAPADFPQSFAEARRAVNIRLHSATPAGASAYDELGFYRLVDAAHRAGSVEDFIGEWLGALLEYDDSKHSQLVATLSEYLECGGNYDESAAALHIHRSTLRYRLARIADLTGYDLRNIDTRFNLHAATRAWRFLSQGT
jgi:hypothetical protein